MKKISIDNGMTFVSPKEAIEKVEFEEIVSWMDVDVREEVHSMDYDSDLDFLEKYLRISEKDLIIG